MKSRWKWSLEKLVTWVLRDFSIRPPQPSSGHLWFWATNIFLVFLWPLYIGGFFVTLTDPRHAPSCFHDGKPFLSPGKPASQGQRFYSAEETPTLHAPPPPCIPHSIVALHVFNFPLQLTETSSRYARKISGTTALQEALKEKQQHIEQLLAERDLERAEVAKATSHVGEIEQELALARDGHDQVKSGPDLVAEMVTGSRLILSQSRWRFLNWGRRLGSIPGARSRGADLECAEMSRRLCWACLKAVPWVPVSIIIKMKFCSSWVCCALWSLHPCLLACLLSDELIHQDLSSGYNSCFVDYALYEFQLQKRWEWRLPWWPSG